MSGADFLLSMWNKVLRTPALTVGEEAPQETEVNFIGRYVLNVNTLRAGKILEFGYSPYEQRDAEGNLAVCAYVEGAGWADWLLCDDLQLLDQSLFEKRETA